MTTDQGPPEIPFKDHHLDLIDQGKKWYTLRTLHYHSCPYETRRTMVPDDLTDEIVRGERYESKEELVAVLEKIRDKLPKEMWLYDFRSRI